MKNFLTVSSQAFNEALRSKILYNIIFLGLFLLLVTFILTEFSYGNPSRVSLDIGLGLVSFSVGVIAILMGSSLIVDEIESRTLYMVLSRPVSRTSFLMGKFFGLALMLLLNITLLFIITIFLYVKFGGVVTYEHFWVLVFIYLEALIVLAVTLFFSCFTNKVITILMGLTLWSCGHGIDQLKDFNFVKIRPVLLKFVELYSAMMPNFNKLNLKKIILNDQFINTEQIMYLLFYCGLWLFVLLTMSKVIFERKELG